MLDRRVKEIDQSHPGVPDSGKLGLICSKIKWVDQWSSRGVGVEDLTLKMSFFSSHRPQYLMNDYFLSSVNYNHDNVLINGSRSMGLIPSYP